LAVTVVSGLVFLSTFSSHVALGDAPESVSGVKTLGVLHAPGYPAYVLAAREFAELVPVGSWALRVNLFSLVCAALALGAVFLLARVFGATTPSAAIASLVLATAASFWFNAGFAKHYAFSALLLAAGALLAVRYQQRGHAWGLVLAGVVLGAALGAAWELALIMTIGVVVLIALGARRPPIAHAIAAAAAMVVVAIAGLAFMVVRAGHNPAINWGDVTTTGRLVEQITQRDFQSQSSVHGLSLLGHVPSRLANYVAILARDVGVGAVIVAALGAVAASRLTRDRKLFLVVVGVGNLVAVALASGIDSIKGFFSGLFGGGFFIDALFVLTVLVALGIDLVVESIVRWSATRRRSVQARPRMAPARVRAIAIAALAVALVAPSLVTHYRQANHRTPPLADLYGRRLLAATPHDAVLIVGGYEFSEPMTYRQIIDGDRRDVTIVSADLLGLSWYRDELVQRMHLDPAFGTAPHAAKNGDEVVRLVKLLKASRPVYLDTVSMAFLGGALGYQASGFVGRVVDGTGPHVSASLNADAAAVHDADEVDGLSGNRWSQFPNEFVYYIHQRAHVELAKQYLMQGDTTRVESELQAAHDLVPDDTPTNIALHLLEQHDPRASTVVRNL
jgi:hypothetical protein